MNNYITTIDSLKRYNMDVMVGRLKLKNNVFYYKINGKYTRLLDNLKNVIKKDKKNLDKDLFKLVQIIVKFKQNLYNVYGVRGGIIN